MRFCCYVLCVGALLVGLISGCSSSDPEVTVTSLELVAAEGGDLSRKLSVELSAAGGAEVEYWTGTSPHLVVTSASAATTSHTLELTRLRAASTYTYQVKALQGGQPGDVISSGTFTTDPLPADLAAIPFTVQGTATSPLTFLSVNSQFKGCVIVDSEGYVVWYARMASMPVGATRRANGNWAVITQGAGIYEFTPSGKTAATLPQGTQFGSMHHDVVATPQNTLLFLTFEPKVYNGITLKGEGIWEWNPESGELTKRWLAFDFFDPTVDKGASSRASDWFHANSLSIGPRGNIVVSSNFLNQVFSIAPDYSSIEWRLGGPGSTIDLLPEQVTSGQHSATEIAPYEVLVFDNGSDGVRAQNSRAYQRKFDPATRSVVSTWEYSPNPANWAKFISSARRLANGNTVVTFGPSKGIMGSTGPTAIHEVNAASTLVWSMIVGIPEDGSSFVFRGEPLESIGGERSVRL